MEGKGSEEGSRGKMRNGKRIRKEEGTGREKKARGGEKDTESVGKFEAGRAERKKGNGRDGALRVVLYEEFYERESDPTYNVACLQRAVVKSPDGIATRFHHDTDLLKRLV